MIEVFKSNAWLQIMEQLTQPPSELLCIPVSCHRARELDWFHARLAFHAERLVSEHLTSSTNFNENQMTELAKDFTWMRESEMPSFGIVLY